MTSFLHLSRRIMRRAAYPAIAVAVGLWTIIAGLDHSTFLVHTVGSHVRSTPAAAALPAGIAHFATTLADTTPPPGLDLAYSHARIDEWVNRLTTSLRGDFTMSLARMGKYSEMITAKLDAKQMPHELIYLAMIESNFNPNARSKVGAVGMWQFMSATARQFGLTVTGGTDDRKNPADATDAALTYLSSLHDRFGSWYLAAAAYNSGAGTVSKALRQVTGRTQGTDQDFFRILSSLPRETQDYVPKLIASARVGSNPSAYGL